MQDFNKLIRAMLKVDVPLVYGLGAELPENDDLKQLSTCLNETSTQNEIVKIPYNDLGVLLDKLGEYVRSGILANRNLQSTGKLVPNGTIPNANYATLVSLKILANEDLPNYLYKQNIIESLFTFYKKELNYFCEAEKKPELIITTVLINKILRERNFAEHTIRIISVDFLKIYFKSTPQLQKECMHLFKTVIKKYVSERNIILKELKEYLPVINANCFRQDDKVHIFTKILLYLIEAFALTNKSDEVSKKTLYYRETFKTLWTNISVLIEALINACDAKESNNSQSRHLFKCFITDLLSVAEDPNWPISSLILSNLLKRLQRHIKRTDSPVPTRKFMMDCIQMLTPIFGYFREDYDVAAIFTMIRKVFPKYTQKIDWMDHKNPIHIKLLLQKFLLDYNEIELNMQHHNNLYLCIWIEEYFQKCIKGIRPMLNLMLERPDYNKSDDLFMEINAEKIDARKLVFKAVFFIDKQNVFKHFLELINEIPKQTPALRLQVLGFFKDVCVANPKHLIDKNVQLYMYPLLYQKPKDYPAVRDILVTMFSALIIKDTTIRDLYLTSLYDAIFDMNLTVNKKAVTMFARVSDCEDYAAASFVPVMLLRRFDGAGNIVTTALANIFRSKYFESPDKNSVVSLTNLVTTCNDIELRKFEEIVSLIIEGEGEKELYNSSNNIQSIINIIALRIKELTDTNPNDGRLDITRFLTVLEILCRCTPEFLIDQLETLFVVLEQADVPSEHVIKYVAIAQLVLAQKAHPDVKILATLEKRLLTLIKSIAGVTYDVMALLPNIVKHTKHRSAIKNLFRISYQSIINPNNIDEFSFDANLRIVAAVLTKVSLEDLNVNIITIETFQEKIIDLFVRLASKKSIALEGLAEISTRYRDVILQTDVFNLYQTTLKDTANPIRVLHILKCILNILKIEQETRRQTRRTDQNINTSKDSLKVIGDVNNEYSMNTKIITAFLDNCLSAYLTLNVEIKITTVKIIHFVVSLGLYNCNELVPHLLALATDPNDAVYFEAIEVLQRIHSRLPKVLPNVAMLGLRQSFIFQRILDNNKRIYIRGNCVCRKTLRVKAQTSYIFDNLKSTDRRAFLANIVKTIGNTYNEHYMTYILYLADNLTNFNYYVKEDLLFLIKQIDEVLHDKQHYFITLKEKILKPIQDVIIKPDGFENIPNELFAEVSKELLWVYGSSLLESIKLTLEKSYNITKSSIEKYCKNISEKKTVKLEDALILKPTKLDNELILKRVVHMKCLRNLDTEMKKDIINDVTEAYDSDKESSNESESDDLSDEQPVLPKTRKITMYHPGTSKQIRL